MVDSMHSDVSSHDVVGYDTDDGARGAGPHQEGAPTRHAANSKAGARRTNRKAFVSLGAGRVWGVNHGFRVGKLAQGRLLLTVREWTSFGRAFDC